MAVDKREAKQEFVELRVPQFGEGIHEVHIVNICKQVNDLVEQDEILYELETSKSIFEIESEFRGTVVEWRVQVGDIVEVGTVVARIATEAGAGSTQTGVEAGQAACTGADRIPAQPAVRNSAYFAPPRTRAYAKEKGISKTDLYQIVPIGRKIMPADIDRFIQGRDTQKEKKIRELSAAQRLQNQQFALSNESLVTATMVAIAPYNDVLKCLRYEFDESRRKNTTFHVTPIQLIAFYIAQVTREFDTFRSELVDSNTYSTADDLNIGIAVETDNQDLATAVIEKASALCFNDFVEQMTSAVDLARRGRDQAAKRPQIIVSYLGGEAVFHGSPLLVTPSIATIAVGAVESVGVTEPRLSLSLTFDHRIITGMEASRFLQAILRKFASNGARTAVVLDTEPDSASMQGSQNQSSENALAYPLPTMPARPASTVNPVEIRADSMPAKATSAVNNALYDKTLQQLKQLFWKVGKINAVRIDAEEPLALYGIDSLMMKELHQKLGEIFAGLPHTLFYEYPTLGELTAYLLREDAASCAKWSGAPEAEIAATTKPAAGSAGAAQAHARVLQEPIAIIGLSGRYPQARTMAEFWENIAGGRDCITEVPSGRWSLDDFFHPDVQEAVAQGRSYSKWGGFIEGVSEFDPLFFNISPREACEMDPQERLFLETVWAVLDDAGYTRESLCHQYRNRVGVFVGATYQHYEAGNAGVATIANRASHFFGLEGPSMAIDTMCSSSAAAIHMACQAILNGDCDAAIAGGVNLSIHPEKYIRMSKMQLLGSHADSRSFGDGDGYLPGEGVGAVLLKPYAKALADGDRIYAVIKATAIRHSGRATGYHVPNPGQQASVVAECLAKAGIEAGSVSYVESAANGSALGDPIELAALDKVFGPAPEGKAYCTIGSVKANIGHPEIASGIAQLSKVVLQLQHRQLAPSIKAWPLNPKLRLDGSAFALRQELTPWKRPVVEEGGGLAELPRRALINSFGAGGTYVSLVVEEHMPVPAAQPVRPVSDGHAQLIVLSARNAERLEMVVERLHDHVSQQAPLCLSDLAYSLQLRREAMETRLAVVVRTREELTSALAAYLVQRRGSAAQAPVPLFAGDIHDNPLPLTQLFGGSTSDALIDHLLAERDLEKLALYWTLGGKVPWEKLHEGKAPHMALPGYPFARQTYWIDHRVSARASASASVDAVTGKVHAVGPAIATNASGIESLLCEKLGTMLGLPPADFPLHRPLRALGFSSIDAMNLKHSLEQRFGQEIALEFVARGEATVAQLAQSLAGFLAVRRDESEPLCVEETTASPPQLMPQIVPQPEHRNASFPLGDVQESFLAGRMLSATGDRVGAHIYLEIEGKGELDVYRLNQAWQRLVERHDMLRTTFAGDLQQVQAVVRPRRFKLADFRHLHDGERKALFGALRSDMENRIYASEEWPLFDIRVSLHPDQRYVIHFSIDELIVDGMSVDILLREWAQLHAQPDTVLPELTVSFRDYVLAQKAFESSERHKRDLAYWLQALHDMPAGPALPLQDGQADFRRSRLTDTLDAAHWAALKAKAATFDVTPTVLLLGIFAGVLRAWSDNEAFTLVLTLANRPPVHPQIDDMVGAAISTSLFVVEPEASSDLGQELRTHQRRLWRNLDHAGVSAVRILRELKTRRAVPGSLTLPVVFTSMLSNADLEMGGGQLGRVSYMVNQTPQVFLDHQMKEVPDGLQFSWDAARGYYADGLIDALFGCYCDILRRLASGTLPWHGDSFRNAARNAGRGAWTAGAREQSLPAGFSVPTAGQDTPHGQDAFPLTDQQQAYAFGRSGQSDGAGNSCQLYQEIEAEELDPVRLEAAWAKLIRRHPMLRTVIGADGNQRVLETPPSYRIHVEDLQGLSVQQLSSAQAAIRHAMMERVAPLDGWPYFEVRVSLLDAGRARIHLCVDLIIADSGSISLLIGQLLQAYAEGEVKLPIARIGFHDYVLAVERFTETPAYAASVRYWTDKFTRLASGPTLSQLAPDGVAAGGGHRRIDGRVSGWAVLKQHAASLGVAPGMILLAAYLEVLFAWNGNAAFSVVVPCWDRLPAHPDIGQVVGDFTAMGWVQRTAEAMPFADRIRAVHRQIESDLAQRPVSGLSVLRRVARRDRARPLAFPVVFTNQLVPVDELPPGFALGEAVSKTAQVCLDSSYAEEEDTLVCSWDFADDAYAPSLVQAMFDGYLRLLERLCTDPQAWSRTCFDELIQVQARSTAATKG